MDRIFVLNRLYFAKEYTIGHLLMEGLKICNTLEPRRRDYANGELKVKGESAIPIGTYRVTLTYSKKFKKLLPELISVPGFTGIRIHAGNFPYDTQGCILLGFNVVKGAVLLSSACVNYIVAYMSGHENDRFYIKITEDGAKFV